MRTPFNIPAAWLVVIVVILGAALFRAGAEPAARLKPTPVILSTDIGDDIDDTWALGLLLKCPELELKLVVTDYGRPQYRARLLGKLLEAMGRADVPIGVGVEVGSVGGEEAQGAWLGNYDLKRYPGRVHTDGVHALIDAVLSSSEPVTVIGIGPLPTVAAALEREPRVADRARFVGMHGSVRLGYGGSTNVAAEWNVKCDPRSAQRVFTAPWEMLVTPLDTCGLVDLSGDRFAAVRNAAGQVPRTIMENYRVWAARRKELAPARWDERSSTLFDCVAIYLATSPDLCRMETLGLRVTDDGFTREDRGAKRMAVAMGWRSLDGFRDWLVARLTGAGLGAGGP